MAQVHIREVVGTVRMVDGESLLTAPMLERIVDAVMRALAADRQDEDRRHRDTSIGSCNGDCEGDRR
jgi:hypothetical protein